jgi:tetratricopeptide (TPR) repeat protein
MVRVDPTAKFADPRPTLAEPPLYHLFGFGLYLYGDRDFDVETQSFVRTLCLCVLYIPLIPIRAYRAAPALDGWSYLERVPVSGGARAWSLAAWLALLGAGGALGAHAVWNAPERVAARHMEQAEQLAEGGRVGDAAGLLAGVARGSTDQAQPAARRLAELLDHPDTKRDPKAMLAVLGAASGVKKAGRWPAGAPSIIDRGRDAARSLSASAPKDAVSILDELDRLGPADPSIADLRHGLLEAAVAADPSDAEWASRLAVDYEARGQLDRCEKFLEPLRHRLGELEGARVLAMVDARANRVDGALTLLRAYTKPRLGRLRDAEAKFQSLVREGQQRVIKQLENQRPSDFDYERYRRAGPSQRQEMVIQYVDAKLKQEPAIAAAERALMAEVAVVPAVLELAVLSLQHAQAQSDPSARKSLLDEAESNFLAVSRMAGEQAAYQINLAQVYYWQGKHDEGRRLLDRVLGEQKRDPALLVQAAVMLREVGSVSEARTLAEEAYNAAMVPAVKNEAAVIRGLLGEDVEERITWIRRANTNEPHIKAILCEDLARQAMDKGDEPQAIANLRQAIAIYESMPESHAVLNNLWISLSQLARLTGDTAAHDRAAAMIQRAAQQAPGDSLALFNASEALVELGIRDLIGGAIDLRALRRDAEFDLLDQLVEDERGREAFAARLRAHPLVSRALSMKEKVSLLAPRNAGFHEALVRVLERRRDGEGLRKLLATLERTELDLSDRARRLAEQKSGVKDRQRKEQARGMLALAEPILPVARAKGGPTFAAAASEVMQARLAAATYGIPVDLDATVVLLEDASAKSPSIGSRHALAHALLFRATDRLTRADSRFADLWRRSFRSLSCAEVLAAVLSVDGPLKPMVLRDPDVDRALGLLHQTYSACPSFASGPQSWALAREKFPQDAAAMAQAYFRTDWDQLGDLARSRLDPTDPSTSLKAYWRARMQHKESEALAIVKNARSRGIPVPIEVP